MIWSRRGRDHKKGSVHGWNAADDFGAAQSCRDQWRRKRMSGGPNQSGGGLIRTTVAPSRRWSRPEAEDPRAASAAAARDSLTQSAGAFPVNDSCGGETAFPTPRDTPPHAAASAGRKAWRSSSPVIGCAPVRHHRHGGARVAAHCSQRLPGLTIGRGDLWGGRLTPVRLAGGGALADMIRIWRVSGLVG